MTSTNPVVEVAGSNLTLVYVVLGISLLALGVAYGLRTRVLAAGEGTEKMKEIAGAVQEGAAAYLARQFRTLAVFVAIVFFLLFALHRTQPDRDIASALTDCAILHNRRKCNDFSLMLFPSVVVDAV